MLQIDFAHPLSYPPNHTARPQNMRGYDNSFPKDLPIEEALSYLENELNELSVKECSLHTNFKHLGNPRLREQLDKDVAACVVFSYLGCQYRIVCDHWAFAAHNIYALHLPIRNARNYEAWGVGSAANGLNAFRVDSSQAPTSEHTGNATTASADWMSALGLGTTATLEDANAIYRYRAKQVAEDEDALMRLNRAIESARKALS